MKLEGSLDAFSLPDVFQLLSLTKKSGGLHLTNGQTVGAVFFAGGGVTGAFSDASCQSLARRLVGLGVCDDAALRRAVERATSENIGVSRALVEAGAVDPAVLAQLALEQAIDAVFDLLRWPEGDFAFAVDETNHDDVGLSVAADHVVAEASNRRETWDAVSRVIPSPEVVLTMPVIVSDGPTISREEWSLLALVNGQRSVGELVEVSGLGQFAVVSTLASLVQRGMLTIHDEDAPDHVTSVRRRQQLLAPLESGQHASPAQPPSEVTVEPMVGLQGAAAHTSAGALPLAGESAPNPAAAPAAAVATADSAEAVLGGAHQPANVVPPRPEPFLPNRDVDHPEPGRGGFVSPKKTAQPAPTISAPAASAVALGGAAAAAQPMGESAIERDPTVNRSLMLRLIAGVRGL